MKYKLLIVDDNKSFVQSIKTVLKKFQITTAFSIKEAKRKINTEIDLILLDLVFDENNPDHLEGLEFLPFIRKAAPDIQIIVMTNYPSKVKIGPLIKSGGASDFFIKKELDWSEWENRIENYCRISHENKKLKMRSRELEEKYDETEIIGVSEEIDFIRRKIKDIAKNSDDISIFIQGETGTGKNLAVKYFRKFSKRKDKPYKEFSIAELSDTLLESELFGHIKGAFTGADRDKTGLFETANGGILFLDEIGDYSLQTQMKIMRFIEDKTITPVGSTKDKKLDVQLLLATNHTIPDLINEGKFREDLYQRINRLKIELPPLRERKNDIDLLADYFFAHFKVKEKTNLKSIHKDVYQILKNYNWPGNVRELQSVIWEACTNARIHNDTILSRNHLRIELIKYRISNVDKIPEDSLTKLELQKTHLELESIDKALEKTYGQKAEAAKLLNINTDQMRYRILKYFKMDKLLIRKYDNIIKHYKHNLK